jgi:predicted dehydrogenase
VIRIGVLGAARVVSYGLVQPARAISGVAVDAIASRTLAKAQAAAAAQAIPRAFGSYAELLDDRNIDAVYVALPTAWHAVWARRALEAGKHVLCEKPLTADAGVAQELLNCAQRHNRVLHEAMHIRHLPKLRRQRELLASGEFGRLRRLESCMRIRRVPMSADDFRLRYELGGGAGLDLGCYAISCLRYVAGEEPDVLKARSRQIARDVDRWMRATLRFPSGARGVVECGFRGWYTTRLAVVAACERGWIRMESEGVAWKKDGQIVREPLPDGSTYQRQLDAFVRSVRGEPSAAAPSEDIVANARVLGAMYAAAGLSPRPTVTA